MLKHLCGPDLIVLEVGPNGTPFLDVKTDTNNNAVDEADMILW